MSGITEELVDLANKEFELYLARKRKKGETLKVLEPPYHQGLGSIRAALEVNGAKKRIFFHQGRWRVA